MKSQSDEMPLLFINAQGGMLINFNIQQKTRKDQSGTKTYFEYDQVKVELNPSRSDIIAAIIRANYSHDDEIAAINNLNQGGQRYIDEYTAYQDVREAAKVKADEVLGEMMS